ncbi:hypothetical protein M8J77_005035 [Diaphorina citri]|nr:hypothetical protein M8J77_005035 [Diaphorina citri]
MATNQASIPNLKVKGMTGAQVYENWKVFQFQFRNFLLAFNHSEAKEEKKVALLLHLLGPEVVNIFQSFSVDLTKVKCDDLIQKFEDFFSPKKKLSLERHKFFTRHQKPQESIESYVTDLKNLASTCEFKNLTESLIKDIFIVGLEEDNQHIKERLLQENEDKTLADIIDIARTIEMSRTNQNMKVQNDVMKVQTRDASKSKNVWKPGERTKKQCTRCGLQFHPVKVCPAAKAKCYKCAKIGHYGKMCFFKQRNVAMLAEEDKEDADYTQLLDQGSHYFIGSILEEKASYSLVTSCRN